MKTLFKTPFVLAFLILGIALSFIGIKACYYYYYFVDYSIPVMATVIESYETTTTNSGGRRNTSYVVKYTYNFEGNTYQSKRYKHSHDTSRDILQYHSGDTLEAFINPDDPSDAVIINEFTWTNVLAGILGIILIFTSLIIHSKLSPYDKTEGNIEDLFNTIPNELKLQVISILNNISVEHKFFESASFLTSRLKIDIHTAKKLVKIIAKEGGINI